MQRQLAHHGLFLRFPPLPAGQAPPPAGFAARPNPSLCLPLSFSSSSWSARRACASARHNSGFPDPAARFPRSSVWQAGSSLHPQTRAPPASVQTLPFAPAGLFFKRRELLLRRIDGALRCGFPLIQRLIRAPRRVDRPLAVCRRLMRRVDARRQPLPRLVRPDFQRPQAVFPARPARLGSPPAAPPRRFCAFSAVSRRFAACSSACRVTVSGVICAGQGARSSRTRGRAARLQLARQKPGLAEVIAVLRGGVGGLRPAAVRRQPLQLRFCVSSAAFSRSTSPSTGRQSSICFACASSA